MAKEKTESIITQGCQEYNSYKGPEGKLILDINRAGCCGGTFPGDIHIVTIKPIKGNNLQVIGTLATLRLNEKLEGDASFIQFDSEPLLPELPLTFGKNEYDDLRPQPPNPKHFIPATDILVIESLEKPMTKLKDVIFYNPNGNRTEFDDICGHGTTYSFKCESIGKVDIND